MMRKRRTVTIVVEQCGRKPRLWAYGYVAVAAIALCCARTVRRAEQSGQLDLGSLTSVYQWLLQRNSSSMSRAVGITSK